ncbi:MAG: hypothetical protein HOF35_01390, partial [Bacteroidetes bacterium]|nr:hypothetical protein [Bacteroidota bacterium]
MKAKYFIITLLVILLVFIVNKMMKFETSIREERIVEVKIYDETKPLFNSVSEEELKQLALSSTNLFTAQGDYFQALTPIFEFDTKKDVWEEIFLKGVNIGAALPGKFPAEFSLTFDEYLDWFTKIGQMNSNVIRTYTILPPEFYDAFAYYNLHNQNNKLFLLQGVWAKIPSDDNYYNPTYNREFKKEIIDVV